MGDVISNIREFLLDKIWQSLPQDFKIVLKGTIYYRAWALCITVILFLLHQFKGLKFFVFTNIGHRKAIRSLNPGLKHATYNRKNEIDSLVKDLARLRYENPKKEVHVIISGGPGAGKSELARQLGEKIYRNDNYYLFNLFDLSFLWTPTDVITLNAENLQILQSSLEEAVSKIQGVEAKNAHYQSEVNEKKILWKFHELKMAFRNRCRLANDPIVIFDNVKETMFSFLYKRRADGRFFLQPGNEEFCKLRVIVTTQYRPMTNFSSLIAYMNLFDPMPLDEAVKLLNKVSNIQNDDKNARYLAKKLGGLPKPLADAAIYIQSDRRFKSSYRDYLEELVLKLDKYKNDVNYAWAIGVEEGLSYSSTTFTASLMLIQQLIDHSGEEHFYQDLACFIGYCASPAIAIKLLQKYIAFDDDLEDYSEFKVKALVRKTSIFEVKGDHNEQCLILTHQITRYSCLIACNDQSLEILAKKVERIFRVLQSELDAKDGPTLNQIVEYTSLDFKVVDVVMSLISNIYKQKIDVSSVVTKEFCWVFLDAISEAYIYWPNNHKSAIIMPQVEFLVDMTEQSFSKDSPDIALLLSVLYLYNTGNQVPKNLEKIVKMIGNFAQTHLPTVDKSISIRKAVLLLNMIGTVYRGISQDMGKAEEFHKLALTISQSYNSTKEIAISLHLLGISYRYQKEMKSAQACHEEAVKLGRKIFSTNPGRLAAFLLNLAVVYNRSGKLKLAETVYQESLALTKEEYGLRDQRVGRVLNTQSINYYALGKYDESVETLLEALSIHEEIHGDYHPNVAESLYFLGFVYRAKGERQNSIDALSRSLEIRQQYYGVSHFQVAEVLHDLSNTQRELNLLDDALKNAEGCVEIFRETLGEDSASFATSLNGLGHIYLARGDPYLAKEKYENALAIFETLAKHGFQNESISETLKNIAVVLETIGQTGTAKKYANQGLSLLNHLESDHPRVKELRKFLKDLKERKRRNVESRTEF